MNESRPLLSTAVAFHRTQFREIFPLDSSPSSADTENANLLFVIIDWSGLGSRYFSRSQAFAHTILLLWLLLLRHVVFLSWLPYTLWYISINMNKRPTHDLNLYWPDTANIETLLALLLLLLLFGYCWFVCCSSQSRWINHNYLRRSLSLLSCI